jgi:uncharacterized protein
MECLRIADPSTFLETARPLLAPDAATEARQNLILGIAGQLVDNPDPYEAFHLWVVLDDGRPVAAALVTPPYPLVLAEPVAGDALGALLQAVRDDGAPVPGMVGNVPFVDAAAATWSSVTGVRARTVLSQGVYALTEVRAVRRAPGASRVAGPQDRPLLVAWMTAFGDEALPASDRDPDRTEVTLELRLSGAGGGLWLWEDEGRPVSLAGFSGRTQSGMRIGPVYTPPEDRRRGYATTLVADLSTSLLAEGFRACFLYTDLANPTSNRIYRDVGYERVADSAQIAFDRP